MMERITAADGHDLDCWMEPAEGARRGGLVILQEIFGVTDQLKGVARRYAALGYDVAIPALFDRTERNTVVPFDRMDKARAMMLAADLDSTLLDTDAAVAALKARGSDKVAVMGFCWGGGLAVRAAQMLDIVGAVSFYGTRLGTYLDRPLKAPVLGHFGSRDDHVPPELLERATAFFPQLEAYVYEAGHAFANDVRPSYVADAADLAHARTEAFLEKLTA